jgi:hypothetical protein
MFLYAVADSRERTILANATEFIRWIEVVWYERLVFDERSNLRA